MVPQVDIYGNEIGGIRGGELRVPLATYFPWDLRVDYPSARHELVDFLGTLVPFPLTEQERRQRRDPRPSIASLYADRASYLKRVKQTTSDLVGQGFLLTEDIPRVMRRAGAMWDWLQTTR